MSEKPPHRTCITVYHNPRCRKSRDTLALVRQHATAVSVIEYLRTPPTVEELDTICRRLGREPLDLIRHKERRFGELGLSRSDERSRAEWLSIMVEDPVLIERPIVVHGDQAVVGRPPENVLAIIGPS